MESELNAEVGAGPLMFEVTADTEINVDEVDEVDEDELVLDVEFEEELRAEDEGGGVVVGPPPLLPCDCVGLLEGCVEMSVTVDDGVVGPSRL